MLSTLKEKMSFRNLSLVGAGAATMLAGVVPAFAAGGEALPTVAITTDMLKPLVDGVVANMEVILPVGIGLFAMMLGVKMIPRWVSAFTR